MRRFATGLLLLCLGSLLIGNAFATDIDEAISIKTETKDILVITDNYIEYKGRKITVEMIDQMIVLYDNLGQVIWILKNIEKF